MKRKVAKIGPSTLMISLPSKWCKHFNIQKGAELELEEQGSELKIKTESSKTSSEITIDIRDLSERTSKYLLGGTNRVGYDIINIKHNKNQIEYLNKLFKDIYLGFIISEQLSENTVFKKISQESEEELDSILRRAFLVTLNLSEIVTKKIKENKFNELKDSLALEQTTNQLTDHCHRLLIKFGYKNYTKTSFLYIISWNLEKIADEYKSIINNLNNSRINKDLVNFLEEIHEIFQEYYNLYYNFSIDKLDEKISKIKKFKERIDKYENNLNKDEIFLYTHILKIATRLSDFSSSFLGANLM